MSDVATADVALNTRSGLVIEEPTARLLRFLREEYPFYDALASEDADHIGPIDVLATVAMNSFINDATKVRTVQRGLAERCDHLLRAIPEDADLLAFDLDAVRALLHEAVQVRYVLIPVATKVLHRKRRALIPMLDSVVIRHYQPVGTLAPFEDKARAAGAAVPILHGFLEDLRGSWSRLENVCKGLREDGFELTPLRALEVLIWTEVEPRGYYRGPP